MKGLFILGLAGLFFTGVQSGNSYQTAERSAVSSVVSFEANEASYKLIDKYYDTLIEKY